MSYMRRRARRGNRILHDGGRWYFLPPDAHAREQSGLATLGRQIQVERQVVGAELRHLGLRAQRHARIYNYGYEVRPKRWNPR